MKSFIKTFFSSCLGVIAGMGCLGFILFSTLSAGIVGLFMGGEEAQPKAIQANTILKIDVTAIPELVQEDFSAVFQQLTNETSQPVALVDALRAVRLAKNNPNIKGIYLNVENLNAGMAAIDELRRALQDFSASGKFIIAYADSYTQKSYYLSSVADKLILNPTGMVGMLGIASGNVLFKDMLAKLGVKMEVFKVGTYKAAVEPFIKEHISPENREQIEAYIGGLWQHILKGVAEARGLEAEQLNNLVNEGVAFAETKRFKEVGLVDTLLYRSEVPNLVAEASELEDAKDLKMIGLGDMAKTNDPAYTANSEDYISVIIAEGEIKEAVNAPFANQEITINYDLVDKLNEVAKNEKVKAVVLRINSPGGSAFLSEQIWHAVQQLKAKKKVVISMGNLAASGGYYISAAGDYIVAEPTTLTGSIGIFGLIPNAEDLAQKIGVNLDVVQTNKFADMNIGLPIKALSEEQKALIQRTVERGYDLFISRVAAGRNMTKEEVDKIGQGRVWLGSKAKEIGLVDELGGLNTAIKKAAELAELEDYNVLYPETKSNFLEMFSEKLLSNGFVASLGLNFLSKEEQDLLRFFEENKSYIGLQTRLPYNVKAY